MDFNKIYTHQRSGNHTQTVASRTDYQRDFDRLIFSSAFRRLQNKTQVFPLPGSVFVHNRLTHSLEVSSVGRSLGSAIGEFIVQHFICQIYFKPLVNFVEIFERIIHLFVQHRQIRMIHK